MATTSTPTLNLIKPNPYEEEDTWAQFLNGNFDKIDTAVAAKQASTVSSSALAALTPAADRLAYFTSTSAAALAVFTAFGRSIVAGVDAASVRTTLGVPAVADLSAYAPASHTHAISNVTGLQTALDGKAASAHNHAISNVIGLQTALDEKATTAYVNSQTSGLVSTTNVLNATAGGSAGQVGTYAFMKITPNTVANPGQTFAGASLMYAAAGTPTGNPTIYTVGGTWMLMGSTSAADAARSCSLFLRIA